MILGSDLKQEIVHAAVSLSWSLNSFYILLWVSLGTTRFNTGHVFYLQTSWLKFPLHCYLMADQYFPSPITIFSMDSIISAKQWSGCLLLQKLFIYLQCNVWWTRTCWYTNNSMHGIRTLGLAIGSQPTVHAVPRVWFTALACHYRGGEITFLHCAVAIWNCALRLMIFA